MLHPGFFVAVVFARRAGPPQAARAISSSADARASRSDAYIRAA
jgi:hypothetical protein